MEKDSDEADTELSRETCMSFTSGQHVRSCKLLPLQKAFTLSSQDMCVHVFVNMQCLTLSLLRLVYLPSESPSCSMPFCCTASAPYTKLNLSQWVCLTRLGSASQKQLFVLYPCAFTKKCVSTCTHTLHSLKWKKNRNSYLCQALAHHFAVRIIFFIWLTLSN